MKQVNAKNKLRDWHKARWSELVGSQAGWGTKLNREYLAQYETKFQVTDSRIVDAVSNYFDSDCLLDVWFACDGEEVSVFAVSDQICVYADMYEFGERLQVLIHDEILEREVEGE